MSLVVLLGFLGLATDVGYLRYMKRRLQAAADAGAIAGASEKKNGGNYLTAAQNDASLNRFTDGTNGVTERNSRSELCPGYCAAGNQRERDHSDHDVDAQQPCGKRSQCNRPIQLPVSASVCPIQHGGHDQQLADGDFAMKCAVLPANLDLPLANLSPGLQYFSTGFAHLDDSI